MLAAFAAAYMSTIATQLNWGSSYIVNDFYRRFMQPGKPERHYVSASKVATAVLAVLGAGVSLVMTSVAGAWALLLGVGAGTGAVYLLRWYWWRINAWSEVSAMTAAAVTTAVLQIKIHGEALIQFSGTSSEVFAKTLLLTIVVTSVVWITVTFMTDPEPQTKLLEFYKRVRPGFAGWKPIAALAPEINPVHDVLYNLMDWLLGCLMVYMAMFGIGELLLGTAGTGLIFLVVAAAAGYGIYWDLSRRGWETLSGRGDQ